MSTSIINTKIKLITENLMSLHANLNKSMKELQSSDINSDVIHLYLYTLQAMTGMVKSILDNLMKEDRLI